MGKMMNLLPDDKRKNDAPRPFPLKIVAFTLIVVLAIIILTQIGSHREVAVDLGYNATQHKLFDSAFMQMATAVAQGTPIEEMLDNPVVKTAKASGGSQTYQDISEDLHLYLTANVIIKLATEQAGTPAS